MSTWASQPISTARSTVAAATGCPASPESPWRFDRPSRPPPQRESAEATGTWGSSCRPGVRPEHDDHGRAQICSDRTLPARRAGDGGRRTCLLPELGHRPAERAGQAGGRAAGGIGDPVGRLTREQYDRRAPPRSIISRRSARPTVTLARKPGPTTPNERCVRGWAVDDDQRRREVRARRHSCGLSMKSHAHAAAAGTIERSS